MKNKAIITKYNFSVSVRHKKKKVLKTDMVWKYFDKY